MKKQFIILAMLATGFVANAQTEKGSRLLGVSLGSLSYNHSENSTSYSNTSTVYNSTSNAFSFNLNPTMAWFVQDNLAIGGQFGFNFYNSKSKNSNTSSSSTSENTYNSPSLYLGPFARYYFSGSEKGKPFTEVDLSYGFYPSKSKSTSSGGSSSETTSKPKANYSAGVKFGYEQFLTKNIGLYGAFGFTYTNSKSEYDYKPSTGSGYIYTQTSKGWSIPVVVGFQVHLAAVKAKK